ncbi:hypothetical protein DMA11_06810 [Marinilabiliaceae bacterium JC017]|nr:hypothetical protein DMA11_06810 [Marinilabiliaceae bacterium JC017]
MMILVIAKRVLRGMRLMGVMRLNNSKSVIRIVKYIFLGFLIFNGIEVLSQGKALEIYMRKNPSKKYVIKIDDKVLVKCRHYVDRGPRKQLVVARLGAIDGRKFYFYPISRDYSETIYTPSTLREIGIKTKFKKMETIFYYAMRFYDMIRCKEFNYNGWCDDYFYKRVNVKSLKWRVRVIDE